MNVRGVGHHVQDEEGAAGVEGVVGAAQKTADRCNGFLMEHAEEE